MKKYSIVKVNNLIDLYLHSNIYMGAMGVVCEIVDSNKSRVLFVNEYNQGDYALLEVYNKDLTIINDDSSFYLNYIKDNIKSIPTKQKGFKKNMFCIYDEVELLVDNERYSKSGVFKGDVGIIIEDYAVKDSVLVDFGRLDKNNNYYGDCISVKLKDLKILNKNKTRE